MTSENLLSTEAERKEAWLNKLANFIVLANTGAKEQIAESFPAETDQDNLRQIAEIIQKRLDQKGSSSET